MTDYKRMVSYMYQYENGLKRRNVGFARIEAKGGQCKITVHMQLLGLLDSIFPTYLIQRAKSGMELIYLGDTILKNQVMDSRLSADENNIMGTGFKLSDMSGILLFLNDKVFYATVWDEKPVLADEVLEALRPKKDRQEVKREEFVAKSTEAVIDKPKEPSAAKKTEKTEENREEIIRELNIPNYMLPGGFKMVERLKKPVEGDTEQSLEEEKLVEYIVEEDTGVSEETNQEPEIHEAMNQEPIIPVSLAQEVEEPITNQFQESPPVYEAMDRKPDNGDLYKEGTIHNIDNQFSADFPQDLDQDTQDRLFKIIEELSGAEINNEPQNNSNQEGSTFQADPPAAKHFFDHYPRIYPFEDNEITHCVKIEPKDIGLLPKEVWPYGNNSFLMHGYYCYHHLIFARMKSGLGYCYILGIPGIYHGREQFMAKMFGFDNFKSIKKRELLQGDFGYWYLPVVL